VLTSTTFIATGTASDDKGVNALTYWFRDEATWQYEITLPHEGTWRMSATAIDNNGQSDLRGATRDWLITSTGVAPSVAINSPAPMTPPTAAPTLTVTPVAGSPSAAPPTTPTTWQTSRSPCATTPPGSSSPPTAPGAPT
jgi:hypothetical protein